MNEAIEELFESRQLPDDPMTFIAEHITTPGGVKAGSSGKPATAPAGCPHPNPKVTYGGAGGADGGIAVGASGEAGGEEASRSRRSEKVASEALGAGGPQRPPSRGSMTGDAAAGRLPKDSSAPVTPGRASVNARTSSGMASPRPLSSNSTGSGSRRNTGGR